MWINGYNHLQLEPVLPPGQLTPPFDCRSMRNSPLEVRYVELATSTMTALCNETAFNIMLL